MLITTWFTDVNKSVLAEEQAAQKCWKNVAENRNIHSARKYSETIFRSLWTRPTHLLWYSPPSTSPHRWNETWHTAAAAAATDSLPLTWSSSPPAGGISSTNMSTMSATANSDWPTPAKWEREFQQDPAVLTVTAENYTYKWRQTVASCSLRGDRISQYHKWEAIKNTMYSKQYVPTSIQMVTYYEYC